MLDVPHRLPEIMWLGVICFQLFNSIFLFICLFLVILVLLVYSVQSAGLDLHAPHNLSRRHSDWLCIVVGSLCKVYGEPMQQSVTQRPCGGRSDRLLQREQLERLLLWQRFEL